MINQTDSQSLGLLYDLRMKATALDGGDNGRSHAAMRIRAIQAKQRKRH